MVQLDVFQQELFLNLDEVYQEQIRQSYQYIHSFGEMKALEQEWAKYKYLILEHSHKAYLQIRHLLKNKQAFPEQEFLILICQALQEKTDRLTKVNSIDHVWGYFKNTATQEEKEIYKNMLDSFIGNEIELSEMKAFLYALTQKYHVHYLLKSYYFINIKP